MAAFDSAWVKWAWGLWHAQQMKAALDTWQSGGTLTPVAVLDADRGEFVVSFTGITDPPTIASLHLADALGAFRQSVEHAARVMVDRAGNPDKNSHFVLRTDRTKFAKGMKDHMPGVTGTDYQLMEDLHEGHIWTASIPEHTPLIITRDINNRDKHNAITAVASLPTTATMDGEFTDCTKAGPIRGIASGPFANGAEIARVPVSVTGPNPSFRPTGTIAATATIERFPIDDLVNLTSQVIAGDVLGELQTDPPASIYTLGVQGLRPQSAGS